MPNVKPTDLARIVAPMPAFTRGYIVTVLRQAGDGEVLEGIGYIRQEGHKDVLAWVCEGRVPLPHAVAHRLGREFSNLTVIADDSLRPIIDPGDDAVDETLQWLRVPSAGLTKEQEKVT